MHALNEDVAWWWFVAVGERIWLAVLLGWVRT